MELIHVHETLKRRAVAVVLSLLVATGVAIAGELTIGWWTVDGSGAMSTTGGTFELSGTIGQPDAGVVVTGGTYELTGGFWAIPPATPYTPGDMNCDTYINFDDINPFITAMVSQAEYEAAYPDCYWLNGDVDANGVVNFDDISPFIDLLVGSGAN